MPAEVAADSLNGVNGFRIDGAAEGDNLGRVGSSGDINADGVDDLVLGALGTDFNGSFSGSAYVVFGRTVPFPSSFSVASLTGVNGFRIDGAATDDRLGDHLSSGFDFNGDSVDDIVIGAPGSASNVTEGKVYVFHGGATSYPPVIQASAIGSTTAGVVVTTLEAERLGRDVRSAGDLNQDGIGDIIIGTSQGARPGISYVIFGQSGGVTSPITVQFLDGANGFTLQGEESFDFVGTRVSGVGDVNGDGIDDVAIGGSGSDVGKRNAGVTYVVFGRIDAFPVILNLGELQAGEGFRITGEIANGNLGFDLASAGDVNGDGFDDILIGAASASRGRIDSAGIGYVVFGFDSRLVSTGKGVTMVDADGDLVTFSVKGQSLVPQDLSLNADGSINVDLTAFAPVADAASPGKFKALNFTVGVKTPNGSGGNGLANLGTLNASNVPLGKVKLQGDLGQIFAGNGNSAVKSLSVAGNFGGAGTLSRIFGSLGKLSVKGGLQDGAFDIRGKLKAFSIVGDFDSNVAMPAADLELLAREGFDSFVEQGGVPAGVFLAEEIGKLKVGGSVKRAAFVTTKSFGAIKINGDLDIGSFLSDGGMKSVKIGGRMTSDDPTTPATITARTNLGNLTVNGDVVNGRIFVGYDRDENPINPDAVAGKINVKGDWAASSLTVGIDDSTSDGFGRNDTVIAGDTTPSVLSKIASVVIKGTATGSVVAGDHFGITAQQIGKVTIGGTNVALDKNATDDVLIDEANGDFRVVEI